MWTYDFNGDDVTVSERPISNFGSVIGALQIPLNLSRTVFLNIYETAAR